MSDNDVENPLRTYERNLEVYELNKLFPERTFVSHWDIDNPELEALHRKLRILSNPTPKEIGSYQFLDENLVLKDRVARLHHDWEDAALESARLLLGDGGSPLITSFLLWMKMKGIERLHYIPPIYYTFHKLAALVGIRLVPISGKHAFEEGFSPNLPPAGGILYVADPIWYVGRRHSQSSLDALRRWQMESGGIVFLDGSFQFMQWDGSRRERCISLLHEQTFRLVSPTKAMALHGLRFAYLICPDSEAKTALNWIYEDSHGPSSVVHHRVAETVLDALASGWNRPVMNRAEQQFMLLRDSGTLKNWVAPECGNFAFLDIKQPGPDWLGLSSQHFETSGFKGYMRVNLLNDGIIKAILET